MSVFESDLTCGFDFSLIWVGGCCFWKEDGGGKSVDKNTARLKKNWLRKVFY